MAQELAKKEDGEQPELHQLDLVIHNMDGQASEEAVRKLLHGLPGVRAARLIPEGAWIRYDPRTISKESICGVLKDSGFRAGVFQDSWSGKTGHAS